MARQALGRGLSALIPGADVRPAAPASAPLEGPGAEPREVPVADVRPNPYQPRTDFDEAELRDLAQSIREQGVLQPILVARSGAGYVLVSGERRLRAVRSLGWPTVPAVVRPSAGPRELAEWAIIENVQRDDLGPLEQARAYARLMDEFSLSADDVAARVGRDRSTIANLVRLLKLPDEVQALLEKGELQMGHARALLAVENPETQKALARKAAREGLSVRAVEQACRARTRSARPAGAPALDPDTRAVEDRLRRRMGSKVRLLPSGKGGRIEIHYYSAEELERLLDILG